MIQSVKFTNSFKCTKCSWHVLRRFLAQKKDYSGKSGDDSITVNTIKEAQVRLGKKISCTPCLPSKFRRLCDMNLFLKCEFVHFTGSFKERGVLNALLKMDDETKKKGVISASLGNHALALSYHASFLKIPVTLVMPTSTIIMNIHQCESYGAKVIVNGGHMAETRECALKMAKDKSLTYIQCSDNADVISGHGTVALEIVKQVPKVDAVLVPVGGGALIAGVAVAIKSLKPKCLVYGVESEKISSLCEALKKGSPVRVQEKPTVADNLALGMVGTHAFKKIKELLDKHIVVSEDWIVRAVLLLIERQKYVVEGSGACGIAAILADLVPELKMKTVVAILTGGNMDTTALGRCLERGLSASGRLVKFKVTVTDRPGGVAELCRMIADIGVSIKDMVQERAWVKGDIFSVRIKLIAETRNEEHAKRLKDLIQGNYLDWEFGDAQQISEEPEKLK